MVSKALNNKLNKDNQPVPQTQKATKGQKRNNAGGFSFVVTDKSRLERFLILGTDGGTYYVNEQKLTDKNVDFIVKLIEQDPELVLNTVIEVSTSGRAYRNSYAIFVMALLFKHASKEYKAQGFLYNHLPQIARTSTHLFEFATYIEGLGGWGRAKREAVANWYTSKTPDQLAYQAVKFRQRDGWTHRDLFRLSHPTGVDQQVGNFILKGSVEDEAPKILHGFAAAQACTKTQTLIDVLDGVKNLPWEAVPTSFHKNPELWKKLFDNGQLQGQALLRQITRLSKLGMFKDMVFAREYANRLVDEEMIAKTRLHPIQYLLALIGHTEGQIQRNSYGGRVFGFGYYSDRQKDWVTSPIIAEALNAGFYEAFKHVEPANKRTFIGVDVSSSMSSQAMGIDLSCAQVAGAMAMSIARTEPYYDIRGFTAGPVDTSSTMRFSPYSNRENGLHDLGITATTPLNEAMRKVQRNNFGSTDCSLPMELAIKDKLEIDTFVVITDNETYAGNRHPHIALEDYRQKSGIDAKLVVVGCTATKFSIANPNDPGMLDVVGSDSNLPKLVADFSSGRV